MFRKPKRSAKAAVRNKRKEDREEEDESTSQLVQEASRANKKARKSSDGINDEKAKSSTVMHQYEASSSAPLSASELATRTAQHHPENEKEATTGTGPDGIFRDTTRNKFLAGPIKASAFVRTTCRFDYQPDICKDYKDTGFCGFGDTCIYLHDRGDTMTGWQLEQEWEDRKKQEQARKQKEMDAFADGMTASEDKKPVVITDDGLPFACHICRKAFTDPVVTSCSHYFCEKCIMDHVRGANETCPICGKDTHGVFNQPTKLLSKKRRLVGTGATWEEFADAARQKTSNEDDNTNE